MVDTRKLGRTYTNIQEYITSNNDPIHLLSDVDSVVDQSLHSSWENI